MNATLKTTFAGIPLENPFLLASAPPTTDFDQILRAFEAGWGGAVLKTAQYTPRFIKRNVTPRICAIRENGKVSAFTNLEIGSPKTTEEFVKGIRRLKAAFPDRAVISSLIHADVICESEWKELTVAFDEAGADAFELNLSCSHGQAESGGGASIGANAEMVAQVVRWITETTKKPVIPKLTALTGNLAEKGLAAQRGGARALSAINTISSLPGIDLDTFVPYNAVNGKSAFQGMSGRTLKPIALRSVAQLSMATGLPISATGGIYTWQDCAEFILAGAKTLQICSAVMENGYGVIAKLRDGLLSYMERKDFLCLDDFCGKALANIVRHNELDRSYQMTAEIDASRCVGCGKCVTVCANNGYGAIRMDGGKAGINSRKCDGCGLCSQICPSGCIAMRENHDQ
ncbi:MAG: NAD-dependent dihydropyrimidine dehydrogenase subunit PreA [Oscillospiraceae bacterium]